MGVRSKPHLARSRRVNRTTVCQCTVTQNHTPQLFSVCSLRPLRSFCHSWYSARYNAPRVQYYDRSSICFWKKRVLLRKAFSSFLLLSTNGESVPSSDACYTHGNCLRTHTPPRNPFTNLHASKLLRATKNKDGLSLPPNKGVDRSVDPSIRRL